MYCLYPLNFADSTEELGKYDVRICNARCKDTAFSSFRCKNECKKLIGKFYSWQLASVFRDNDEIITLASGWRASMVREACLGGLRGVPRTSPWHSSGLGVAWGTDYESILNIPS